MQTAVNVETVNQSQHGMADIDLHVKMEQKINAFSKPVCVCVCMCACVLGVWGAELLQSMLIKCAGLKT